MTSHDGYGERWFDQEAGPVVRPYAVTKGRTQPAADGVRPDRRRGRPPANGRRSTSGPGPSTGGSSASAVVPMPVVDLTSEIDLPLGVVRVLLGDLAGEGMLRIVSAQRQPVSDQRLLRMVLDGLESL